MGCGERLAYADSTKPRDALLVVLDDKVVEVRVAGAHWQGKETAGAQWMADEAELGEHPPVVEVELMELGMLRIPIREQRFAETEAQPPLGARLQRVPTLVP
jgi:hypothetical protein